MGGTHRGSALAHPIARGVRAGGGRGGGLGLVLPSSSSNERSPAGVREIDTARSFRVPPLVQPLTRCGKHWEAKQPEPSTRGSGRLKQGGRHGQNGVRSSEEGTGESGPDRTERRCSHRNTGEVVGLPGTRSVCLIVFEHARGRLTQGRSPAGRGRPRSRESPGLMSPGGRTPPSALEIPCTVSGLTDFRGPTKGASPASSARSSGLARKIIPQSRIQPSDSPVIMDS